MTNYVHRDERAMGSRVTDLERQLAEERLVRVKTTIAVFERGPDDTPLLVSEEPDLDLLMDPVSGVRVLRHQVMRADLAHYEDLCGRARDIPIRITCHEKQREAITNDSAKVVAMMGGNRAGKTEVLGWRLLRRWMLRGGNHHRFWWISPQREQTQIAVGKLCIGRSDKPPILPPALWTSFPRTFRAGDQTIRMIDGSLIQLFHAGKDGGNLRGYDVYDLFYDDLTAIKRIENWRIGKARTIEHAGTVSVATTPIQGHWARSEIIARAPHSGGEIVYVETTCFDNPWLKEKEIWRSIENEGGVEDPVVQREYFGKWVVDGSMLWPHWKPEFHQRTDRLDKIVRTIEDLDLPDGYADITAQVAAGFWREHTEDITDIGGQDFNVDPMTTVVCRIFGKPGDPETWGLWVYDEVQTKGTVQMHCDNLIARGYEGMPIACDPSGARRGTHVSQGTGKGGATNAILMRRAGFDCKPCHQIRGVPMNPGQLDSINLMHVLFRGGRQLVHSRCKATVLALDTQEAASDGRIAKVPGSYTDKLSAPTDALRYLDWAIFHRLLRRGGIETDEAVA